MIVQVQSTKLKMSVNIFCLQFKDYFFTLILQPTALIS